MNKPKKGTKIPLPRVPGKPAPRPKTDPGKVNKQPINKPMPVKPGKPTRPGNSIKPGSATDKKYRYEVSGPKNQVGATAKQKKAEQIKKLKEQTLKANARKQDRLKTIKNQTRKGMR